MASNSTANNMTVFTTSTLVTILDILLNRFVKHLPLIFIIFGLIGFLGNVLTYLQPELRSNTCCIYLLCGSIVDMMHLFINLLTIYLGGMYGIYIPWTRLPSLCKFQIFIFGFLPHLSINFLLMSIIDRYASTCSFTSSIRRINHLKMVPWVIGFSIFTSFLALTRPLIFYEYTNMFGCIASQSLTNNILYIVLNGLMQPITMFIFVVLTFRNVQQSRKRVAGIGTGTDVRRTRNQFIKMIFTQILATALISLQWMIMFALFSFLINNVHNFEQSFIIYFTLALTNYCYYLNNVKSFYISIFTSHHFRKVFIRAMIKLLPRYILQRWQTVEVNNFTLTAPKINQPNMTIK
ncbi:hypothetical protein I4U23_015810 [Adineta vaga]|nr:hypothetical protein I4U23_015810 [Adineta vaga]